uniref:Maturase-like protein n=1 Tax=Pellia epiphylla TaxID=40340 RepID=Q0R4Y3_9MARC|nr:maturase-like protein [Pellia epiphylla]
MNNFAQRWLFSTNHKCDAMHAIIAGSNRAGTTGAKPHATLVRVMSCVGVDGLVIRLGRLGKRILTMRPPFLWSVHLQIYGLRVVPFSSEYLTLWGERSVPENRKMSSSYCGDTSSPDAIGRTSHSARFRHDGGEGGAAYWSSRPGMSCKPHANGGRDSDSTENRSGSKPPAVHMDGGRKKLERNGGSKFGNIYSICTDPNFLIAAYEQIKSHTICGDTGGGVSRRVPWVDFDKKVLGKKAEFFEGTAELLRSEQFRFNKVIRRRRNELFSDSPFFTTIGSDEIVQQQAMKIVMEHIYEPRFLDISHGFRPGRGCHSGLEQIQKKWGGASWFLEFDIRRCFHEDYSTDRHKLVFILQKDIEDQRWMDLVHKLNTAGLVDPRSSRSPWALAPLLCNIYLHELDQEVAKMANELSRRAQQKRTTLLFPTRRAAFYVRYAGNFPLGINAGPKELVVTVKSRIVQFVNSELHPELAGGDISHISAESVKFMGMEIKKVVPKKKKSIRSFGKAMEKRRRVRNRISTPKVQKRRGDSLVHASLVRALGRQFWSQNNAHSILREGRKKHRGGKIPNTRMMAELAKALLEESTTPDIRRDSRRNFHLALASRLDFGAPDIMDKRRLLLDFCKYRIRCDDKGLRANPFLNSLHDVGYEALSSLQILAPLKEIRERLKSRGLILASNNKPRCVVRLIQLNDEDIVLWFNSVARDLLSYYRRRANSYKVRDYVDYFLRWSLIHTMAGKHKTSATKLIGALSIDMVIIYIENRYGKTISFLSSNEIRRMGRMFLKGIQCGSDMRTLDYIPIVEA